MFNILLKNIWKYIDKIYLFYFMFFDAFIKKITFFKTISCESDDNHDFYTILSILNLNFGKWISEYCAILNCRMVK